MQKNGVLTLEYSIDAKCLNCKHFAFPDTMEDVDYGTCGISNQEEKEIHYCEEWSIYSFWIDFSLNMELREKEQENGL